MRCGDWIRRRIGDHPRCLLAARSRIPPRGGDTSGPAKPVPRYLWTGTSRAGDSAWSGSMCAEHKVPNSCSGSCNWLLICSVRRRLHRLLCGVFVRHVGMQRQCRRPCRIPFSPVPHKEHPLATRWRLIVLRLLDRRSLPSHCPRCSRPPRGTIRAPTDHAGWGLARWPTSSSGASGAPSVFR